MKTTEMSIDSILTRFRNGETTRALAFGSSNTERRLTGMHWFDCFELAIAQTYGRVHRCINTGIGGHTTRDLLRRFEEDAALYRPHVVFITIGGNDANPANTMDAEEFEGNLLELHGRFKAFDCAVVFQTYYSPNPGLVDPSHLTAFYGLMDIVRQVAHTCEAGLIDHLARWEPFREAHAACYGALMRDGFHVNRQGNMVMGLDIARHFDAQVGGDEPEYWAEAREIQGLMDACGQDAG